MVTRENSTAELPGGLITLAWALATNAVTAIGVTVFGWPAGNAFLLFIIENIATLLLTYLVLRRTRAGSGAMDSTFFLMHAGIFTAVHTIFSVLIAGFLGIQPTLLSFGLPVGLLLVRFVTEVWALIRATSGPVRPRRPPGVIAGAYGRVFALHLGIFPGMFAGISSLEAGGRNATVDFLEPIGLSLTYGQAVVVLLMLIKSVADIIVSVVLVRARARA